MTIVWSLVDWTEAITFVGVISPCEVMVISFLAKRAKITKKLTNKTDGKIKKVVKL